MHKNSHSAKILPGLIIAFCLKLVIASQMTAAQAESQADPNQIDAAVKKLGSSKQNTDKDFQLLNAGANKAISLLVFQLHPIARATYYPDSWTDDSRHVVNCLRALRYITGITFTAQTKSKLNEDERQFLDFKSEMHDANPEHKIHFFGVWMSRDAVFVAPQDAQRQIIKQWRQWQQKYGNSFQQRTLPKPSECFDEWYWYG